MHLATDMSLTMPPMEEDIADLLRRRNVSNIPKDQRILLEKDDSWAVTLKNSARGLANVPGHVLETVKQAHIANKCRGQSPASDSSQGSPTTTEQQNEITKPSEKEPPSSPSSAVTREVSWSPSPQRRPAQDRLDMQSSIVRETPKGVAMAPPPRPEPPPQIAPNYSFASSDHEEEDLEMELPQAQIQSDVPVTRGGSRLNPSLASPSKTPSTQSTNTPPCAQPNQPAIASSVAEHDEPPPKLVDQVDEEPRPRRRMKPIMMSDDGPRLTRTGASTSFARKPAMKSFEHIDSSNSTSSGSIIPATFPGLSTQVSWTNTAPTGPVVSGTDDAPIGINSNSTPQYSGLPLEKHSTSGLESEELGIRAIMPTIETAHDTAADPLAAFTSAYPTYISEHAGTLRNFVKACICLEFLREQRGLRDCLYDDFIRAFSSGFLKYVTNAGPNQEPLPAVEWFNNISGPCLFNEMVVTKQNLASILQSYPEEVTRARAFIKGDDDDDEMEEMEVQEEEDQIGEEAGEGEEIVRVVPDLGLDGAMDIDDQAEATVSSLRVAPLTQMPGPPSPQLPTSPSPDLPPSPSLRPSVLASPQLGSEATAPLSSAQPRGARTSRPFRPSQYFNRLASSSRSNSTSKGRSAAEQARLREHFQKRKSSGTVSTPSTRGASRELN